MSRFFSDGDPLCWRGLGAHGADGFWACASSFLDGCALPVIEKKIFAENPCATPKTPVRRLALRISRLCTSYLSPVESSSEQQPHHSPSLTSTTTPSAAIASLPGKSFAATAGARRCSRMARPDTVSSLRSTSSSLISVLSSRRSRRWRRFVPLPPPLWRPCQPLEFPGFADF